MREALMGGATRTLLGSMKAPMLIFLLKPIGRAGQAGAAGCGYFLTSGQVESASLPNASSPLIVSTSL